jgi:hypothetical protein
MMLLGVEMQEWHASSETAQPQMVSSLAFPVAFLFYCNQRIDGNRYYLQSIFALE